VREISVEEQIAAEPQTLYGFVSDVTRMGEWSPETTSCRWLGGATGPAVGAKFRGSNRSGWRRWSTTCTVVEADPGRAFAFEVKAGPFPVARWTYEFTPSGPGTKVTERWTDQRTGWMVRVSPIVTGVGDRPGHNREGMERTLAALRRAGESAAV
jgi:hypothetical protein